MQRDWLYRRVTQSVQSATHIYIRGRDGNLEIVQVNNSQVRSNELLGEARRADPQTEGLTIYFTYRFINFEWKPDINQFVPIRFNCEIAYSDLRTTYTNPNRIGNEALREL